MKGQAVYETIHGERTFIKNRNKSTYDFTAREGKNHRHRNADRIKKRMSYKMDFYGRGYTDNRCVRVTEKSGAPVVRLAEKNT